MHLVNWHLKFGRSVFYESTGAQRDRLSIFLFSSSFPFPSVHFKRSNPAQLPWQSNPCSLFSDAAKYSKNPCCCDLTAIAVPSQVAAFLREPFQIKAFSQKTLKSRCRQALNKRTHFLPVSSQALRWKLRGSTTSCCSSVCCDVRGGGTELWLWLLLNKNLWSSIQLISLYCRATEFWLSNS